MDEERFYPALEWTVEENLRSTEVSRDLQRRYLFDDDHNGENRENVVRLARGHVNEIKYGARCYDLRLSTDHHAHRPHT
jgi:poly(A) polymerase Pap1